MASTGTLILDKKQISQKLERIAWQIYEDNFEEKEIVLAGVVDRGYKMAKRLQKILKKIAPFSIQLVKIDLDKEGSSLKAQTDVPIDECRNKAIILVDDVLNSGRTLVYGLGVFLNIPVKKLRTAVLIDRSHRSFPLSTDFAGMQIATVMNEHISVVIDERGETDAVYLR
ncbi:MAG: phosphoribosyltransferase [Mucilaginibacter polytrichastri]|nr:phosphoribosyltransferase [Mucilaginibacter polytrichastri]